jgi:hypothetical protein
MTRTMRTPRLLIGLIGLMLAALASPSVMHASDQSTFENLIARNAITGPPFSLPLRPRSACLCNSVGSVNMPGFLAFYPKDGMVYCVFPHFDATGSADSYGFCTDFAVLGH